MGKGDPKGGRPTKLTDEVRDGIAGMVQRGLPYDMAARSYGVVAETVRAWRRQGEADIAAGEDETPHAVFSASMARAENICALELLDNIKAGDDKEARKVSGATWLLERRHREFFGRSQTIEHTGEVVTRREDLSDLEPEQRQELAARALARNRKRGTSVH